MKKDMKSEYVDWILNKNHPCVMAHTVFTQENVTVKNYGKLGDLRHTEELYHDLLEYIRGYDEESKDFQSFIAVFENSEIFSESEFEKLLWKELDNIHQIDDQPWDPSVSSDPDDDNFSFSIGSKAFYLVGLHPGSSRKARQSPYPSIAFNLHSQFEMLREMGAYQRVKKKIRQRDMDLQGSINPELEDFGNSSEARQYSGKLNKSNWKCPFHN